MIMFNRSKFCSTLEIKLVQQLVCYGASNVYIPVCWRAVIFIFTHSHEIHTHLCNATGLHSGLRALLVYSLFFECVKRKISKIYFL